MAHVSRNRQFRRSGTSNKSWAGTAATAYVAVAGGAKVLLGTFTLSSSGIDETILRTVGGFSIRTDTPGTTEDQFGAFGLTVVSSTAAAQGIASVPGPITDLSDDGWFVYAPFAFSHQVVTAVGVVKSGNWVSFDSKAKRKFEGGSVLAIVVENSKAGQAFEIAPMFRILSMVSGT